MFADFSKQEIYMSRHSICKLSLNIMQIIKKFNFFYKYSIFIISFLPLHFFFNYVFLSQFTEQYASDRLKITIEERSEYSKSLLLKIDF